MQGHQPGNKSKEKAWCGVCTTNKHAKTTPWRGPRRGTTSMPSTRARRGRARATHSGSCGQ
eukprot:323958-Prorocentrum_lima.AAC.1